MLSHFPKKDTASVRHYAEQPLSAATHIERLPRRLSGVDPKWLTRGRNHADDPELLPVGGRAEPALRPFAGSRRRGFERPVALPSDKRAGPSGDANST